MSGSGTRFVAGGMTGTSLDGLDVALAQIEGCGLSMSADYRGTVNRPLGALADELRGFASGEQASALRYARAGRQLGELYADAVAQLCHDFLPEGRELDFVVAHGQTIAHAPSDGLSWQLFDPWPIVRRLGVPVCYDLRQSDLIAGGQGAPITPLSDWVLYRHSDRDRVVVNLGGICNATCLPGGCNVDQVRAEDIGPCNLLIDAVVRSAFPDLQYDEGGALAAAGKRSSVIYDAVRKGSEFFDRPHPRTAGREEFGHEWVQRLLTETNLAGRDGITAATEAAAALVADYISELGDGIEVVLAGGGAKNPFLVEVIGAKLAGRAQIVISDNAGIPAAAREAMGFAVLGALTRDGLPITLPQVTGAQRPGLAGAWAYP